MNDNKIAQALQKIEPGEASQERMLIKIHERAGTERSSNRKEIRDMDSLANSKPRFAKRLKPAFIAAVLILTTLTLVAFAYSEQIIQLLGGGWITSGTNRDGDYVSITTTGDTEPVEIRDGMVYFILDGNDTDITSFCTETTYYQYDKIADNGYRHVFIVGGAPGNLGWSEFIYDGAGERVGSTSMYNEDANGERPEWLQLAEETFGHASTYPVRLRGGQVYFKMDGSYSDITSYCTETTYYMYEYTADNGYRHVMVVGGTPDRLGWSEYYWDEGGNMVHKTSSLYGEPNGERPAWLQHAEEELRS